MNYRIEAPEGTWTKKTVTTHLGGDAYLTVKLTQANLTAPIVVEFAELWRKSLRSNDKSPVALRDVEVIDRRGENRGRTNLPPRPYTSLYDRKDFTE
jgi:hypothetical protein